MAGSDNGTAPRALAVDRRAGVRLVPVVEDELRRAWRASSPVRPWEGDGTAYLGRNGAGIVVQRDEWYRRSLLRVTAAGRVLPVEPLRGPVGGTTTGPNAWVDGEGRRALYLTRSGTTVELLDVETGEQRLLLQTQRGVESVALLDDGRVMVATDHRLGIYAIEADRCRLLAQVPVEIGDTWPWGGGRLLLHLRHTASRGRSWLGSRIEVFGWAGGRLGRVAELRVGQGSLTLVPAGERVLTGMHFTRQGQGAVPEPPRVPGEIVGLADAWQRFADEVAERIADAGESTALVTAELLAQLPPGSPRPPAELKPETPWIGAAGLGVTFGSVEQGYELLVCGTDGARPRPVVPPLRAAAPIFAWCPGDREVLFGGAGIHMVDLATGTSRPVLAGAGRYACRIRDGIAVLDDGVVTLFRWSPASTDPPQPVGRFDVDGPVAWLDRADPDGDCLAVACQSGSAAGWTWFVTVQDGRVYPLARIEHGYWPSAWCHDGTFFLRMDGFGDPSYVYRVTGLAAARERALAGQPVERLTPDGGPVGLVLDSGTVINAVGDVS